MLEEEFAGSETLELVQEAYEGFKVGNLSPLLSMLASDVDWFADGPSSVPIFGRWEGPAGVRDYYATLLEHVEYEQFEPQEYILSGETVVVLLYVRAIIKATGRRYAHDSVHVLKLRDGLIVHRRSYSDTAEIAAAFRQAE
jgi:ketosteroid isomerase-like protein